MALRKTKKRSKTTREKGSKTVFGGARKKRKKSGHRGGSGMSGSGKRADHKKTLITKLYGHGYFGKQGITSKSSKKDKRKKLNLQDIELRLDKYIKEGIAKKTEKGFDINLKGYKVLGEGNIKTKMIIKADSASKSAIDKVKKAGGNLVLKHKSEVSKEKGEESE